ncbi:MAG: inorganic phosphate transporter [Nitrososphaerota archaeon]
MDFLLLYILCLVSSILFSWNNSSLFVSGMTSSGAAKFRYSVIFTVLSMFLGLMLEGWKMNPSKLIIFNSFEIPLIAILVILLICSVLAIPVSISNIAVASLIGSSLALNIQVNQIFLTITVLSWILAPLATMYLSKLIYLLLMKLFRCIRMGELYFYTRLIIYSTSFYGAYTISANNLGFILSMLSGYSISLCPIVYIGILIGASIFSEKISYVIGDRLAILSPLKLSSSLLSSSLLLWILTQVGIPAALTQIMIGGLVGAALSSSTHIINVGLFKKLILSWAASFLLGVVFSYLLVIILK